MDEDDLEQALSGARRGSDCVAVVARYFSRHSLAYGHGTDNPHDEAYWLVRAAQAWDEAAFESAPDPATVAAVAALARRRARERRPLAYLLNEAWFAGLRFFVDEHVLVPRSPLAELIERGFAPWIELRAGDRVLDLGTGSGCIAIAIAWYCPGVAIDAVEVSPAAAAVARRNISAHGVADRVRLIEGDVMEEVMGPYRIIVSNPPYVPDARIRELPVEYAHEPEIALAGGHDGLSVVRRILSGACRCLASDGVLLLEVGEAAEQFLDAYPGLPATWLDFESGGEGVCMLTHDELAGYFKG